MDRAKSFAFFGGKAPKASADRMSIGDSDETETEVRDRHESLGATQKKYREKKQSQTQQNFLNASKRSISLKNSSAVAAA